MDGLRLTPRELEILGHAAAGRPIKVIALRLGTSPETVRSQLAHVRAKNGAANTTQLVALAVAAGRVTAAP